MVNPTNPLVTPAQYLLANGTKVISDVPVSYYSASEILKIEVAGGILVLAVLVLTYTAYQWWNVRYKTWLKQQELEDRIANGEVPDPTEYPSIPPGVNKTALYVVGALVMIAGIAMMVMP
jgi:hypothetical protein